MDPICREFGVMERKSINLIGSLDSWPWMTYTCLNMIERLYSILIVDDEESIRSALRRQLRRLQGDELEILEAKDGMEALKVLETRVVDLAIVDLRMPVMDGFALLTEMRTSFKSIEVLILTANGSINDAVRAIQLGASDFMEKPFHGAEINARIQHYRKIWSLNKENEQLKEEMAFTFGFEKLIGTAHSMIAVKRLITQAGLSEENILIQGETGTGKELVARALHFHSPRKHEVFVPVDCASLSENIVDSELFGYVKGAFTGAVNASPGLIRVADGGTIFFDEIGELPLGLQAKLLRVIQEKEVRPVGGTRTIPVNVRFLAATNRNLEQEVSNGTFREDLFFRLNVIMITVPSLRDRIEDIPVLARFFLDWKSKGANPIALSQDALESLERYAWPGNVRELENVLHRAAVLRAGDIIDVVDLPQHIGKTKAAEPRLQPEPADSFTDTTATIDAFEAEAIKQALLRSDGNRRKTARILGIGEATLYRKLKKYKIMLSN
jgi:DNA-binding NtrC family response regulator